MPIAVTPLPFRGFPCRVDFCPSREPPVGRQGCADLALSALAPQREGNLWVAPVDDFGSASPLTKSARPLLDVGWTYDGRHQLFSDDASGEGNHRIWAITRDTADAWMLTPEHGDAAWRRAISPDRPDTIVAGLNDRDATWHYAWTIDLASGRAGPGIRKPGRHRFRVFDYALSLRLLRRQNAERGGSSLYRYDAGVITPAFDVPHEDDLGTTYWVSSGMIAAITLCLRLGGT